MTARWAEFDAAAPQLAATVRRRFSMGVNCVLATLRSDGSPRVSAIELTFTDVDVTLGMMGDSVKLADVRRDPRVAVHSPTVLAPQGLDWPGDAKFAGRLHPIASPPDNTVVGAGFFRFALSEVTLTAVGDPADHLVITTWRPDRGIVRTRRS